MTNLFQTLEDTAARGAEGLTPEAHESVVAALHALQQPDGGFAGLDGRSDPYYTFFAWLSLRALGVPVDRGRLCAYMAQNLPDANTINARCVRFLLAVEGQGVRVSWLKVAVAMLRDDAYSAFLLLLVTDRVPRWLVRVAWRKHRKRFALPGGARLPTPRLAAALVLATQAREGCAGLPHALAARRCAEGGYASAQGASADLLATAVARFAIGHRQSAMGLLPQSYEGEKGADLMFTEACWLEDGLFGASPAEAQGDAEHTFYGLLSLGTCR